jgi:serine/threonine-protein kinase RsbT
MVQLTDDRLSVRIATEADLIAVRQVLREQASRAGFGLVDVTKLVTAGSELARNILVHAPGAAGELRTEVVENAGRRGGRATVDIDAAMTDGFSTGSGLGLGLPGSRRLMDELEVDSTPGAGTRIRIVKWGR